MCAERVEQLLSEELSFRRKELHGEGGRVHGAKCLAVLAGVAYLGGSRGVPVLVPVRASPVPSVLRNGKILLALPYKMNSGPRDAAWVKFFDCCKIL